MGRFGVIDADFGQFLVESSIVRGKLILISLLASASVGNDHTSRKHDRMAATIDEIARRAGVSRMTVARALNGTTKQAWPSSQRRVERIRQIADELGYKRHSGAAAVRSRRFGHIGMLTRDDIGLMQFNLTKGVAEALAQRDLHMTYCEAKVDELLDRDRAPRLLREHCVDGMLIHLSMKQLSKQHADLFQTLNLPVVWVNNDFEFDCVRPDDFDGGHQPTRLLIEQGHRHIAYLHDPDDDDHFSWAMRRDGYVAAMNDAGLEPQVTGWTSHGRLMDQVDRARAFLQENTHITGVVINDSALPAMVLMAAAAEGLHVPDDLSIIARHNSQRSGNIGTGISTVRVPMHAIGVQAVDMLVQKMAEPTESIPSIAVPFDEPEMSTIAPPRSG